MRSIFVRLAAPVVLLATACGTAGGAPSAPTSAVTTPVAVAQAPSPALPQAADLTLAQAAGSTLIGLSVRPGLPGPNTLLLYVAPLAGPSAALDVPLTLDVNGTDVALATCSRTCRSATVTLAGGEHLRATVGGNDGGTAGFDLPALPAPDGDQALQQVQDRMHQLHSYRVDERLGPTQPPLTATYLFQAPDRVSLQLGNGARTVWIGAERYTSSAASSTWRAEAVGSAPSVPSFEWDAQPAGLVKTSAHILGRAVLDGVETQLLAFFAGTPQTPVWYQLWADETGLIHTAEMRAQGHFMIHRYTDFDAPSGVLDVPDPSQGPLHATS